MYEPLPNLQIFGLGDNAMIDYELLKDARISGVFGFLAPGPARSPGSISITFDSDVKAELSPASTSRLGRPCRLLCQRGVEEGPSGGVYRDFVLY